MKPTGLFEVEKVARRVGTTTALVPVTLDRCPSCGSAVVERTVHVDALLRSGGYGATTKTATINCTGRSCRWTIEAERSEERPPRGDNA